MLKIMIAFCQGAGARGFLGGLHYKKGRALLPETFESDIQIMNEVLTEYKKDAGVE